MVASGIGFCCSCSWASVVHVPLHIWLSLLYNWTCYLSLKPVPPASLVIWTSWESSCLCEPCCDRPPESQTVSGYGRGSVAPALPWAELQAGGRMVCLLWAKWGSQPDQMLGQGCVSPPSLVMMDFLGVKLSLVWERSGVQAMGRAELYMFSFKNKIFNIKPETFSKIMNLWFFFVKCYKKSH